MLYPHIAILLIFFISAWQVDVETCLPPDSSLILAWVAEDDLYVWQGEPAQIVADDVLQAFIAPDAAHIAFTRADGESPVSLWIVKPDGSDLRQLVNSNALAPTEGILPYINQVAWLNAHTLIFNTAVDLSPSNDLWLLDINSGEIRLLLPPEEGGAFTLSPDAQWIAVVYHGNYGIRDGRIRLITPDGSRQIDLLNFPGVSTGSEYRFYPQIFWEVDSTALRFALPDPDLIYDESAAPPTVLWRLTIDGSAEQIGAVQASFFGLPTWSFDGRYLTYMQRVGSASDNLFNLILAEGDGTNAITYASGATGMLSTPSWIPDSSAFLYAENTGYTIGLPNQPLQPLTVSTFAVHFLDSTHYLYATNPPYELRLAQLNTSDSCLIMALSTPLSALDVVLNRP